MEKVKFRYGKNTYTAYDAQRIVFEACKFESSVSVGTDRKRGNAKSIVGLISMHFINGEEYYVIAEGKDAAKAATSAATFISALTD